VLGDDAGVTGLRLKNNDGSTKDIDVHGVFIAIGHTPNTGIFEGSVDMTPKNLSASSAAIQPEPAEVMA
jgi:thioredoxin reductase (NADPH)